MSVTQPDAALPLERAPAAEPSWLLRVLRVLRTFARRSPMSAFWGCVAAGIVFMAVAAPVLAPHDPTRADFREKIWDHAAGALVVAEAGGVVTDIQGRPLEFNHGRELALEWIESREESVAAAGWATLSSLVAIKDDANLDQAERKQLLQRVQKTIHQQPNRVRHLMNGFVIAVGSYVQALTDLALQTAGKVGPVTVDMGGTACKVQFARDSIEKIQAKGAIGKKRKTAKC